MPDPQRVDAGHRGDCLDVSQALGGLDLGDHQRPLVQRRDLEDDVAALVVIVREAERRAAASLRRIAGAGDDVLGFGRRADHRNHHSQRAHVERAGDEVIFAARNARHGHDVEPATQRALRLQRLEAEPGVLHVVEHEVGAGVPADLRQARREEFEHHSAIGVAACAQRLLDWIVPHRLLGVPDGKALWQPWRQLGRGHAGERLGRQVRVRARPWSGATCRKPARPSCRRSVTSRRARGSSDCARSSTATRARPRAARSSPRWRRSAGVATSRP